MAPAMSERMELAKLCSSRDWSKAIRILDSLLSQSCAIQDLCNRAFCYSQLELHKHVIKDCDKALQLDPTLLQAYIFKGCAFSALGRKEEAVLVWEQGYEHAVRHSADLKQLLELEDILTLAKQEKSSVRENHAIDSGSSMLVSESGPSTSENSSETSENQNHLDDQSNSYGDSRDTSEVHITSTNNVDVCNGISEKDRGTGYVAGQMNGNHNVPNKLSYESESCDDSSDKCSKLSRISSGSSALTQTPSTMSTKLQTPHNEVSDESNKNKKFCVTRISKTKSISVDFRLSRGIAEVNEGKYAHAITIFDELLKEDPNYPEALIGRGTALAFQRELEAAIADFTKAIQINPAACEAWKRRGQARAALGEFLAAIEDLSKALEFEPYSADILHERGIVNFKFKDFDAAVEDLSTCVKLEKDNTSAYTYLGLAFSSIGEYKKAEEAHLKSIQLDRNFLEAWGHLTQFYQDMANSTKALECLHQVLQIDGRFSKAYHWRGLLLHGLGEHRKAIKDLSTALSIDNANIECFYLRASCYHAVGEYKEAVKDYDAALDLELDSMDKFVLQCLAFYQKELALYTASKIYNEFSEFDIDGDIDPLFKEYWCKRLHPKNVCEKVYRQPPLRESLKKGKLRKQDLVVNKHKTTLLQAADSIGKKIQYNCPGFLPNRRQHRMAGLAAIEIAQKVSKAWRKYMNKSTSKNSKKARRRERINVPSQNRGGAGCTTSGYSEITTSYGSLEDKSFINSMISWQDVYSLAIKWRQISEPCDPVVWINKLSEEFNAGFGSHTPMFLGQAKVVRYYPNFERTLEVAKKVIKDKQQVYNEADDVIALSGDKKLQDIMDAKSCSDLYRAIGEDFWLATWCSSTAFEGKRLEGTRITLVKMEERGFDFAIRTPCMPSRWDEFDAEMAMAWEAVCNAYCGENYGSTDFDALENVRDAILRMTYYWYNFMPLSRGSAVVGFVVMLGLLLAANMRFTGSIPKGLQLDWEAILNFDPSSFIHSIKGWFYPSLEVTTSWKEYPDVASTFTTTGSVVAALSSYND
ncbi:N-terminal acetyltransferase A, auxiliary subunit [Parasponia andersonii]|uniref:N-terminal acetyltransferase A, auxiliary subunit n=1 Tax=Parasponia andersonii TaxID=3476 RepID=A0A2P5D0F0_PARAD|nr:N-terminal acetyltransferase A, auxiliary subunit [Parasponia andersonii]